MESVTFTTNKIQDRRAAGLRLAGRLSTSQYSSPVVIAIPHGGVEVGAAIAQALRVPLNVMPCRKIADPSDKSRTIGSVSGNAVVLHNCPRSVPQSHLYFKTTQLRSEIESEMRFYYEGTALENVQNKTVILVDDILRSSDTMIACLRDLRKQRPLKIIVAVPFVEAEAARLIQAEADEIVFLKMQASIHSPLEFYSEFEAVEEWVVRDLLVGSRGLPVRLPRTPAQLLPQKLYQLNKSLKTIN